MLIQDRHGLVPADNLLAQDVLARRAQILNLGRMRPAHLTILLTLAAVLKPDLHLEVFGELVEVLMVIFR